MTQPRVYCHQCSIEIGCLVAYTDSLLGTEYQLRKYVKHTAPDSKYNVQSVFESSDTKKYEDYVVSSAASGIVELDSRGRRNIVWVAGRETGFRFEKGRLIQPLDAVKVVLSTATCLIHAPFQMTPRPLSPLAVTDAAIRRSGERLGHHLPGPHRPKGYTRAPTEAGRFSRAISPLAALTRLRYTLRGIRAGGCLARQCSQ